MSPDRYGDRREPCPNDCRNGWLTPPDSDAPQLCPRCREIPKRAVNDFAEQRPSLRAQHAIEGDNQ